MKVENHDTTKLHVGNQHENLLKREIQILTVDNLQFNTR
jgi:hypothetical protein